MRLTYMTWKEIALELYNKNMQIKYLEEKVEILKELVAKLVLEHKK